MGYYSDVYSSGLIVSLSISASINTLTFLKRSIVALELCMLTWNVTQIFFHVTEKNTHGYKGCTPSKLPFQKLRGRLLTLKINGWKIQGQAVSFWRKIAETSQQMMAETSLASSPLKGVMAAPIPALGLVYVMAVFTDCS